jgi:hypothetical protein
MNFPQYKYLLVPAARWKFLRTYRDGNLSAGRRRYQPVAANTSAQSIRIQSASIMTGRVLMNEGK